MESFREGVDGENFLIGYIEAISEPGFIERYCYIFNFINYIAI
ncbi:hypothetical protein [uncultured Clostridium sp.]|nr:hypothetical protein [uncultured Clostridium sp.]